jgi:hypothetical protein
MLIIITEVIAGGKINVWLRKKRYQEPPQFQQELAKARKCMKQLL